MRKILVVLAAAFATVALYATPVFAAATSPLAYSGQGTPLDSQCDASNTAYLQFNFTYGGNFSPTNVTLSGIAVTSQSEQGNMTQFITAYADPTSLVGVVSVSWTGEVGDSANLVISHGCAGETGGTEGDNADTADTVDTADTADTADSADTADTADTTGDTAGDVSGTTSGDVSGTTSGGTTGGGTTGGTTGGTAPTGGSLPFTGFPIWVPLLAAAALLGTGIMFIRRKKGELS
jgi:hypothetical protein